MNESIDYAEIFKAVGDETRLKILEMLSCGELCACDILESFQITQPTLSYHMKILTRCGLVTSRKEGIWMFYSGNLALLESVETFWRKLSREHESCICKKRSVCDVAKTK